MNSEKQNIGRKIYLLCATVRVEKFINTHKTWINKSKNFKNVITKVVVDFEEDYNKLNEFGYDVIHYTRNNRGVCKPLYYLTSRLNVEDSDIIVVMSDDFSPPDNWDDFLFGVYNKVKTGGVSVEIDGPNAGARDAILSLPIMDGITFNRINKMIYHPSYNHMYSDNELYDNLKHLNLLHILHNTNYLFKHNHWSSIFDKRDFDEHDKNIHGDVLIFDKNNYLKRKKQPIEKKLKWFKLSILISSLNKRRSMLNNLLFILKHQIKDNVEVVILVDNGEKTIGVKRNELICNAMGEYLCFIDDDDAVSDDYVKLILEGIEKDVDCVGISGIITTNGRNPKKFIHSVVHDSWKTCEITGDFLRSPNHLNPIKRHIVETVLFDPKKRYAEDKCFSDRIKGKLKTEYYIDKPIYYYLYITKNKQYLI